MVAKIGQTPSLFANTNTTQTSRQDWTNTFTVCKRQQNTEMVARLDKHRHCLQSPTEHKDSCQIEQTPLLFANAKRKDDCQFEQTPPLFANANKTQRWLPGLDDTSTICTRQQTEMIVKLNKHLYCLQTPTQHRDGCQIEQTPLLFANAHHKDGCQDWTTPLLFANANTTQRWLPI